VEVRGENGLEDTYPLPKPQKKSQCIPEILKENKTVGEGCGRGNLLAENNQ
jgi:hypothetical protein